MARSWARRPKQGDALAAMLRAFADMLAFVEDQADRCRLHVMERHPRIGGTGEYPDVHVTSTRRRAYEEAVLDHVIEPHRSFWERFYGAQRWRSTPTRT